MVKAQEWLDLNYPKNLTCQRRNTYQENNHDKTRNQITMMSIRGQNLEGSLDLSDFVNLETLDCSDNLLEFLHFSKNEHEKINTQLERLDVSNNNFSEQSLSMFSSLVNLKILNVSNQGKQLRFKKGISIFNKFEGSLNPLKNLTQLRELDISNTNIDSGLEFLPEKLDLISCANCLNKKIENQLKGCRIYYKNRRGFSTKTIGDYNYQLWRTKNLFLIKQIKENNAFLNKISIISDLLIRQNNYALELTTQEKVFQIVDFYLRNKLQLLQKELYSEEKIQAQIIQTPLWLI